MAARLGDFHSALELYPGDKDARHNADVVDAASRNWWMPCSNCSKWRMPSAKQARS